MSRFATQKERLEFVEKQLTGHHWIFNGPEERAIMQEMAAILKELHDEFREFRKSFQEGEG